MNPQEEQGLELAKDGLKDLLAPVTDIIRALLGPAATEVGFAWGDSARAWRCRRLVRLLEDVRRVATDADIKLKPVAPILEAASLEDDEDLHWRWVALLTNTASHADGVLPCFSDILRQLTSQEAQFLDGACNDVNAEAENHHLQQSRNPAFYGETRRDQIDERLVKSVHPVMIDNMERLKLVTRIDVPLDFDATKNVFPRVNHLFMSELGITFVRTCRLPRA